MTDVKASKFALSNLNQVFERWVERIQKFQERTDETFNLITSICELEPLLIHLNLSLADDAIADAEHVLREAETKFLHMLGACDGNESLENYKAAIRCAQRLNEIREQIRARKTVIYASSTTSAAIPSV